MKHCLCFLLFLGCSYSLTPLLHTSCRGLSDGYHDLQLLTNQDYNTLKQTTDLKAPVVNAKCHNGYVIIDVQHDPNFINYFSSWHIFEMYFGGVDLENRVAWRQWFLPTSTDLGASFSVTIDTCNECEDATTLDYGRHTIYHETADAVGCGWAFKCPYNQDTLKCQKCSAENDASLIYWGKCGFLPNSADKKSISDHSWCNEVVNPLQKITLPSIGITGTHCVCYQPSADNTLITANMDTIYVPESAPEIGDKSDVYKLYQKDFEIGTYRIRKPGKYRIMEDITFDFQSGDIQHPNAPGAWFLDKSLYDDYIGAGEWDGYYWLGFFAGITIETDDVSIDLQGHTLQMSRAFYFQQRYFMIISITNKPFIDGAGPTFCGYGHISPSNVEIKNGVIGLSSHMGIFGSNVTNVILSDLHVQKFETHGILLNQYKNLRIENVEIGPSVNGEQLLSGDYNLARFMLPTFRAVAKEISDEEQVSFMYPGRDNTGPFTFNQMLNNLIREMDIVFHWAYFGEKKAGVTDDEYKNAVKVYGNPMGVSRAGSMFGLVLRPKGASVFNWGQHNGQDSSYEAYIKNLYIHDLILAPEEVITLQTTRSQFSGPLAIAKYSTDPTLGPTSHYIGNTVLDILISMRKLNNNWWYLGRMLIMPEVYNWAFNGYDAKTGQARSGITCGMDSGGHTPKGVVGMKFERSQDVQMFNVRIENLINMGIQGSAACGDWTSGDTGGNIEMNDLWSTGYYGTHARAMSIYTVRRVHMSNIKIKNIMSLYGPSYGMFIHQSDDGLLFEHIDDDTKTMVFDGVSIEHIDAGIGAAVDGVDLSAEDYSPNWSAEACAVSCENKINEADNDCSFSIMTSKNVKISQISGHTHGCTICNINSHTDSCLSFEESAKGYTKVYQTPLGNYAVGSGIGSVKFSNVDKNPLEFSSDSGVNVDQNVEENDEISIGANVSEKENLKSGYSGMVIIACFIFVLILVPISVIWCYFYYKDVKTQATPYQPLFSANDDCNTYLSTF